MNFKFTELKKIFKNLNVEKKHTFPVELKGDEWINEDKKPVAIFIGFNPWKRDIFHKYFDGYKVAYVLGNASWERVVNEFLLKLDKDEEVVFVKWGARKLPVGLRIWLYKQNVFVKNNIKVLSVEDGFLRSLGAGLLHTKPASICIDKKGIYFDANQPSDLENILLTYDFRSDQTLMKRARHGLSLMRAAELTKYYNVDSENINDTFSRTNKYSILVIGQVEGDASIKHGKTSIRLNTDLVKKAREDFPEADIYFKPHPDYIANNRKSLSNVDKLSKICVVVPEKTTLRELINKVDHVYTITSLAGLESLFKGKKVTTLGAPFYSNWGLTDDKVIIKRRNRQLSLEEMFAGAYLLYPKYMHVLSDEESTFEETASYFIFEVLKHTNILEVTNNKLFSPCIEFLDVLSTPLKVMHYIGNTNFPAEAITSDIMDLISIDFKLVDYPQISFLLGKTANYDALIEYTNYCLKFVESNIKNISEKTTLLNSFFYSLSLTLRNSNGRVINPIPCISSFIIATNATEKNIVPLLNNYVACCAMNLQYQQINNLLKSLPSNDYIEPFEVHQSIADIAKKVSLLKPSVGLYKSFTQIMVSKPSRAERNMPERTQLRLSFANKFLEGMNNRFPDVLDTSFNKILYYLVQDEVIEAEKEVSKFFEKISIDETTDKSKELYGFKSRLKDWLIICNAMIKKKRFKTADLILSWIKSDDESEMMTFTLLSYYKESLNKKLYYDLLLGLDPEIRSSDKIAGLHARVLREEGLLRASKDEYIRLNNKSITLARKNSLKLELDKLDFCLSSSKILNSIDQPKMPKGIVFLASQSCFNTLAMMIPSLVELKKKGYAVVNLMQGMTEYSGTGLEFIDKFHGVIPLNLTDKGTILDLSNQWEVDWQNKRLIVDEVNYYQGFYEGLSASTRRYHVDITVKDVFQKFNNSILRADTCLSVCKNIFSEIVISKKMPVTFVTGNSHVTPYSVFRDFSRSKNHPLLGFINCNVAYESYFSNVGSKFANTMCVTDMTLYPLTRAPFLPRKDQFDAWYDKNLDNADFVKKADDLIQVNRVGHSSNEKELALVEYLKDQKARGVKIVCAFGKVPVDLCVPFDGGPAHSNMADWISHTVDICNGQDNILLLVKPHPHELRPEIALDLVESFHDLIDCRPEKNVLLLGHKDINGHALAPYLDLAILYNGSSALELTAQGIPVIMTSYFGQYDYPINLIYPKSRSEYKEFILSTNYPLPDQEIRKKAAFMLSYLGTDEISILNQYSLRQLTNDKIGIPKWQEDKVSDFLVNGDPKMELIASRIVEKFECHR
ncbi:hypothetical protein [Neptunomonas qingdaonensis]|uniref:Capsular polysaccharide export protein n=1 Tax=Neptunomonas qingdaonensis TaxID=1045558 RepID=A0A1I2PT81_9GAMM|nr:hypothetical protein [Neptunomonas qingdaonensis]SFG19332.1 capsular polysaccharide export protein [Neptunomonas qingdaonensis]